MVSENRKVDVFKTPMDVQAGIGNAFCVAAAISIATKGSFSVAIPSGSVVKALGQLAGTGRVDFSKVHVFFTNDKVGGSQPSYEGALADFVEPCGIPMKNVYPIPGKMSKAQAAQAYARTVEQSRVVEGGFDLVLLGTGEDGHCASLFPNAPEVAKEGGSSYVAKQGEDAVTATLGTINAAKRVILSATGKGRGFMVMDALAKGETSGMPAGMVAAADTTWFVDDDSIAEYREEYGTDESMAADFNR